jgi:hypothetical protein
MASDSAVRLHEIMIWALKRFRRLRILLPVTVAAISMFLFQAGASAQAVTWTRTDIGSTGATGWICEL